MTQQHPHPPAAGVALSYPAAQHALARYRRAWAGFAKVSRIVAFACLGGFLVSIVVAVAVGGDAAYAIVGLGTLLLLGAFISGILAALGSQTLQKADQMEWIMTHYPWVERYRYHVAGHRKLVVTIEADQNGPRWTGFAGGGLGRASYNRLLAGMGYQPLLVAGDPQQLAVVTTPAMQDLYLVRPNMFWM